MRKIFCLIVMFFFIYLSTAPSFATSEIWEGGVSGNTAGANWNPNALTSSGDSWEFANNGSYTTIANNIVGMSVAGITFDATNPGYIINGNSITLTGNIVNNSSNNETIGMGITGGTVGTSGTGAGSIIISGAISAAVSGVTQDSSSTLVLSNTNSYTGTTTITTGTLKTAALGAIPVSSDVTIANGAKLDLDDHSQAIGSLAGSGTVTSSVVGAVTLAIGADDSSTTFSGVIQNGTGTVAINKQGSGTFTLSGNNTYTGGTILSAGTLNLGGSNAIGSTGSITFNGGALQYSTSNTTDYSTRFSAGAGQQYNIDTNGQNVTFAGNLTSSGGVLTKIGSGTLTLSGNNTYSGGTTLDAGTLALGSANAIGSSGTITFNGGVLQYSLNNTTDYSSRFSNAASQQYDIDTNGQVTPVTFASALNSVGGSLTKLGAGTLVLSAVNGYTGATTISAGTLQLAIAGAISSSSDVSIANGATLDLDGNSQTIGSLAGAGTVTSSVAGGATLSAGVDGLSTTFSGNIVDGNDTVGFNKQGSGTLILSGNNTYSQATTLSGGELNLGSATAIGAGTINFNGGVLQYSASNRIDYSSQFSTDPGQQYKIDTNGQPVTLATDLDSVGGSLTKLGSGILTLTGNNTYSGTTTLSGGELNLGSANAIGSGTIVFNGGALQYSANNATDYSSQFSTAASQAYDIDTNGRNVTFASNLISSGGTFIKLGNEVLTLTGNNTYNGTTTLSGGELNLGSANAIGSGTIVFNGGALQYSVSNNTDYSSQFSTAAAQAYDIDTNGRDVVINTALNSVGGSLTKLGNGALTLSVADSYSGATTISGGKLILGNVGSISSTSDVSVASGAILDLNDKSATIGSLAGAGTVISGTAGSITLAAGADGSSTTFSGSIQDNGTTTIIGINKQGSGTLVLSGNNTYSGETTLSGGELGLGSSNALGSSSVINFNGGALQYSANNTIDNSALFSTAASQQYAIDTNGQDVTLVTDLDSAGGSLTKLGTGTLILTGNNTYSGATTLSGGELNLGSSNAIGSGLIVFNGGALQYSDSNNTDYSSQFSIDPGQRYAIDTNDQQITLAANLDSAGGSLTKLGGGILTLTGNNTYSGTTTLSGGELNLGSSNAIGSGAIIFNGGALQYSASNTTDYSGQFSTVVNQEYDIDTNGQNVMFASNLISSGGLLTKLGDGTLTLSGNNTYNGGTTINGGTLQVENPNALGTGAVINNAILDIGTTHLSIGSGAYTQASGSKLNLTIVPSVNISSSVYGKVVSTVAASVASGSTVNVTVDGYIPNNTTFTIIDTAGTGITGSAPAIVNSSSSFVGFTSSISNGNLILTAKNSPAVLASYANNANARAVATALGNVANTTSDMNTVLGVLESQSSTKISSALNTMSPVLNEGVKENTSAAMNNLVAATLDRIQSAITRASTGVSSGDEIESSGIWAKPYGSYLTQIARQDFLGYNAWNAGTAIGFDRMVTDTFVLGISGAYAYGQVNSSVNNSNTGINSAQGAIYAGWEDPYLNNFIDATGSFAWNWYNGQRDISIGSINRTADASYDGQQYGIYLEGGHKIYFTDNALVPQLQLTPLASVQYTHLSINSYTETNAGSMDLSVASQSYNVLESGLGVSLANPIQFNWGIFTPEVHVKWLHDYINDNVVITSSFTGGSGGSFTSTGSKPTKDGANVGGKLSFDLNGDISLIAEADMELKQGFLGAYGSGTVRYKF